ncbi:cation diffusion facilitator family transporter [Paenibacillus hamazuiensis]|uniref:cation diffusion facilitator family transporter n=1 Tax=Paenibacillus hamazuiensis TaxID=2936508 RepID=UPI00200F091C|nr:cation diffusion facilitator family transporter [Paenibacillus hamazuiensis]
MSAEKKASMLAAWVSLISNIFLTVVKIAVGLWFGSEVLVADGVHNAGDVIASIATFSSMRISNQPADQEHPYGHGKAEVISAGIVAIILALAALFIGYGSIQALLHPAPEAHIIALAAALLSLIWKQVLYVYTYRIGKKLNSKGLLATAYDHLADVYASIAAVVGIGAGLAGEHFDVPILKYGDPIAGIIVSVLVLKLAVNIGKESVDVLMEKNIDPELIEEYARLIRANPHVKRIDRLRAREHGHYILVDVRASVPGTYTIQQGHDISRQIKQTIMDHHPNVDEVLIHLNPWYDEKRSR